VTKNGADRFKFKVPTLRNIAVTFPYFHDGSTSDLAEAVKVMAKYQAYRRFSDAEADKVVDFSRHLPANIKARCWSSPCPYNPKCWPEPFVKFLPRAKLIQNNNCQAKGS